MDALDDPRKIRLLPGQWEKCQDHADRMSEEYPGVRFSPVAVLRMALDRGLESLTCDRKDDA